MALTKANLIDKVAASTERTKKEAEQAVEAVLTAITDALERGEKVDLRGFGSFQVNSKAERQGRNPKTGEPLTIAARNVAAFKPSKELSDRVNGAAKADSTPGIPDLEDLPSAEHSEGSAKVHGDKIDA